MNRVLEVTTSSEEETFKLGQALGACLKPGDSILLSGDLGSGKTVLAKGIVSKATGVSPDEVVSPTFTLINTFAGPFEVHHADLYRLERDQVDEIGLEATLDEGGTIVVEWAERTGPLGTDPLQVTFVDAPTAKSRLIRLEWHREGCWEYRLGPGLRGTFLDEKRFTPCGEADRVE